MTDDLRKRCDELQQQVRLLTSEQARAEAVLASLRQTLGVKTGIALAVAELMNYAVASRAIHQQLAPTIEHLRGAQSVEEARAIGNSLEALFRAAQVPQVLARR